MTSVYISNDSIQAVTGKKGKNLKIKRIVREPIEEGCILNGVITDEASLRERLAAMWKANKLPKRGLSVVIESSAVSTKSVTLPNLKKPEYMRTLLADALPESDNGDVVYDYRTLSPSEDGGVNVMGCMAERSFVKSYIELFEGAGLKLEKMDLALCGQIKLARFCSGLRERSYILSVINGNMLSQMLFINGEYRFSNRQRIIYNRDTPEFSDEVARMVSSLVQFNKSEKSGSEITDVFFCGFSENEINSSQLMFGSNSMRFQRMPEQQELVYASGKPGWLSDCVFAVGNLL